MMPQRPSAKWQKHLDFILLDELSLQVAFILAYLIRQNALWPYTNELYRSLGIFLVVVDLLTLIMTDNLHGVLKRGYYREFSQAFKNAALVFLITILWLFSIQRSFEYSRVLVFLMLPLHTLFSYGARLFWKRHLRRSNRKRKNRSSMLVVLESAQDERIVAQLLRKPADEYILSGIVLLNEQAQRVRDIPVVCDISDAAKYICRNWIDCVFISTEARNPQIQSLISRCMEMSVPVYFNISDIMPEDDKQRIDKVCGKTVITVSGNHVTYAQYLAKRSMDVVGGLIGSLLALIVIAVFAPVIRKESGASVIYKSERIGLNGKHFQMLKIRTMYPDAEARKASLQKQNRMSDGMMFKLDFDPRVIGNRELPDGTRKTGIGEFLRKTSLDEFPQFINVLKGDMSLVGTRPPTPDEWEKYEYHHRARLATRPGITGLWQVSGRNNITDFEEVVALDTKYIQTWSIGQDVKILLKTVASVIRRDGAM